MRKQVINENNHNDLWNEDGEWTIEMVVGNDQVQKHALGQGAYLHCQDFFAAYNRSLEME